MRAADRQIQAVQEAVASMVFRDAESFGPRSPGPGAQYAFTKVLTARRVPAKLLAAMATMDGAVTDADKIASALVVDLPCFPADAKLMMTDTVPGSSKISSQGRPHAPRTGTLSSRSGVIGVSILVRASAESDGLAADLLVQSATSRGVRLRTVRVLCLTRDLRLDDGSHETVSSVGRRKLTKGLKRGRKEEEEEEDGVVVPRFAVKEATVGLGSTEHKQSLSYEPGFTTSDDGPGSYKIGSTAAAGPASSLALSGAADAGAS